MKLATILLFLTLVCSTLAILPRTDCSCTCADGTQCIKAVPNFLEFKTTECQCKDGTCPKGKQFNGKFFRSIFSVFSCILEQSFGNFAIYNFKEKFEFPATSFCPRHEAYTAKSALKMCM